MTHIPGHAETYDEDLGGILTRLNELLENRPAILERMWDESNAALMAAKLDPKVAPPARGGALAGFEIITERTPPLVVDDVLSRAESALGTGFIDPDFARRHIAASLFLTLDDPDFQAINLRSLGPLSPLIDPEEFRLGLTGPTGLSAREHAVLNATINRHEVLLRDHPDAPTSGMRKEAILQGMYNAGVFSPDVWNAIQFPPSGRPATALGKEAAAEGLSVVSDLEDTLTEHVDALVGYGDKDLTSRVESWWKAAPPDEQALLMPSIISIPQARREALGEEFERGKSLKSAMASLLASEGVFTDNSTEWTQARDALIERIRAEGERLFRDGDLSPEQIGDALLAFATARLRPATVPVGPADPEGRGDQAMGEGPSAFESDVAQRRADKALDERREDVQKQTFQDIKVLVKNQAEALGIPITDEAIAALAREVLAFRDQSLSGGRLPDINGVIKAALTAGADSFAQGADLADAFKTPGDLEDRITSELARLGVISRATDPDLFASLQEGLIPDIADRLSDLAGEGAVFDIGEAISDIFAAPDDFTPGLGITAEGLAPRPWAPDTLLPGREPPPPDVSYVPGGAVGQSGIHEGGVFGPAPAPRTATQEEIDLLALSDPFGHGLEAERRKLDPTRTPLSPSELFGTGPPTAPGYATALAGLTPAELDAKLMQRSPISGDVFSEAIEGLGGGFREWIDRPELQDRLRRDYARAAEGGRRFGTERAARWGQPLRRARMSDETPEEYEASIRADPRPALDPQAARSLAFRHVRQMPTFSDYLTGREGALREEFEAGPFGRADRLRQESERRRRLQARPAVFRSSVFS